MENEPIHCYYIFVKSKSSVDWEPNGVWKQLDYACYQAAKRNMPFTSGDITALKYQECSDWLPNGSVIKEEVMSPREIRALGRQFKWP